MAVLFALDNDIISQLQIQIGGGEGGGEKENR